jgi:putative SOS response-associated peptidase YedK
VSLGFAALDSLLGVAPLFLIPGAPAWAGLWDGSRREDGTVVRSCAIVTLPGNALMRDIHNTGAHPYRMPAILRAEDHATWMLGSARDAKRVLCQYPEDRMRAFAVSTRVNSPKNNDAHLTVPVPSAPQPNPCEPPSGVERSMQLKLT